MAAVSRVNTPAHMLLGAAVFGRGSGRWVLPAALFGGFAPDLSLYLLAGVSIRVLQIPPQVVFNELYYSPAWQAVFRVDNSVFAWGVLLGLALWRKAPWAVALTAAALLHIALDFPLHVEDARAHFWPLTNWTFESPVSYWDSRHGARWVAPILGLIAAASVAVLWRVRTGWGWRFLWASLLAFEMWTLWNWLTFF